MKKNILLISMLVIPLFSCGLSLFKDQIQIKQVISEKKRIDHTGNPALKHLLKNELSDKVIGINNVIVKDITTSTNIDYDFCVIVDVVVDNEKVECFIYSKNINTIAKLDKGKTKISAEGRFSRFFTMLDEFYIKIEIIDASIKILEEEKK